MSYNKQKVGLFIVVPKDWFNSNIVFLKIYFLQDGV